MQTEPRAYVLVNGSGQYLFGLEASRRLYKPQFCWFGKPSNAWLLTHSQACALLAFLSSMFDTSDFVIERVPDQEVTGND